MLLEECRSVISVLGMENQLRPIVALCLTGDDAVCVAFEILSFSNQSSRREWVVDIVACWSCRTSKEEAGLVISPSVLRHCCVIRFLFASLDQDHSI